MADGPLMGTGIRHRAARRAFPVDLPVRAAAAGGLALWASCAAPAMAGGLDPDARVAFFGVHLIDSSLDGVGPAERARARAAEARIAAAFAEHGFELLPLDPVAAELDAVVNPARCNDCELRLARRLGADYAVVSEVQKVSNLILSMNIVVRDAATGAKLRGISADIRGNTDESWQRGFAYILRNNIFKDMTARERQ